MDKATATLIRPSVARLQVEIDLQKELPNHLWINLGDNKGFWQYFQPDGPLPSYCNHCWHLGHSDENCNIKHPELKLSTNSADLNNTKGNSKLIYKAVQKSQPEVSNCGEKENEIRVSQKQPISEDVLAGNDILNKVNATAGTSATVNANGKQALDKGKSVISYEENEKDVVNADTRERNFSIQSLNRFDCLVEEDREADTVEEHYADRERGGYDAPEKATVEVSAKSCRPATAELPSTSPAIPKVATLHEEPTSVPHKLNVDATAWHPQNRQLPPSFGPFFEFNAPEDYGSWRTDSAEEEVEEEVDGEDSMDDFLDSQFIRDDLYLEKRKNRKSKRERDLVQSRRGRGRPLGSLNRTYSDIVHPMTTRSKRVE